MTGAPRYDTVAIVGLDGYAVAKAQFDARQVPVIPFAGPLLQAPARVAANGVAYVDGHGVVRFLPASGPVRTLTTFPVTQPQQEISFAISPDGHQVMAAVLTIPPVVYSSSGEPPRFAGDEIFHLALQAATADGSTRTLSQSDEKQSNSSRFLSIVGWDDVGPLATVDTSIATQQGPLGHQWYGHVAHLDAAGHPGPVLGGADCQPQAEIRNGTLLCEDAEYRSVSVRSPDGHVLWSLPRSATAYGALALSPDGGRVAYSELGATTNSTAAVHSREGSRVNLPPNFYPAGWLDANTIIGCRSNEWSDPFPGRMGLVHLNAPLVFDDLGFDGTFVGSLD